MLLSPLLQEYLVENRCLPLPEAGQLTIQQAPAQLKTTDQTFAAPALKIVFSDSVPTAVEVEKLTAFISRKLNISDDQATALLKNETMAAFSDYANGDDIQWPEWKLFSNKKENDPPASQPFLLHEYLPLLPAEKIRRQPVVVQETAILPAEIIPEEQYPEMDTPVPVDYSWVWVLIIFIISVLLIANYYT